MSSSPNMSKELHVYRNKVIDWVIAESPSDADAVLIEHGGGPPDEPSEWEQLPDDRVIWIRDEDLVGRQEKTCAEWAAERGRCFLASTEF